MLANDKIYVSEYLKDLNNKVEKAISYHKLDRASVNKLTCKDLSEKCEVTQATITNLTTSSKYFLLHRISEEILDNYYGYFELDEAQTREDYPDEVINPRDVNYILMKLTTFYTNAFLNS